MSNYDSKTFDASANMIHEFRKFISYLVKPRVDANSLLKKQGLAQSGNSSSDRFREYDFWNSAKTQRETIMERQLVETGTLALQRSANEPAWWSFLGDWRDKVFVEFGQTWF